MSNPVILILYRPYAEIVLTQLTDKPELTDFRKELQRAIWDQHQPGCCYYEVKELRKEKPCNCPFPAGEQVL